MNKGRQSRWYVLGTLVLAVVLLILALRGVEWAQLLSVLGRSQLNLLLLACTTQLLSYAVRSLRWRMLLSAEKSIALLDVFSATMVGYLGNNFLPARAGELMRAVLLGHRTGLSKSFILGTILTERLIDVVAVVILGGSVLLLSDTMQTAAPNWLMSAVRGAGLTGLAVIAGLLALRRWRNAYQRWFFGLPLSAAVRVRIITVARNFWIGVQSFRRSAHGAGIVSLTIAVWSLEVVTALSVAYALALSLAPLAALFLLVTLALSSAAPSTPGYVGVYQFVAVTVLALFDFSASEAVAYIIALQLVSYLIVTPWGLWGLWRLGGRRQLNPISG